MLPSFTKINKKFENALQIYIDDISHKSQFISKLAVTKISFEGNKIARMKNGKWIISNYEKVSTRFSFAADDIIKDGPLVLIENYVKSAEEIKKASEKLLFEELEEAADEEGNSTDFGGKFDPYKFMESIEKIELSFDDFGNYSLELINFSNENYKILVDEFENNPNFFKRWEEMMERKRKEWNDRESNRKLVD